ncbi:transposase [Streptomyces scopuliridis]|uniref:transposase n=1 Tax=Streptomyces scopuliridis TaxID=452529 RepID=UPI0036CBD5F8
MVRGDLTVTQLALLEPLLLLRDKPGRPSVHSKRQLINGIRFRTRTGIPWRDLPPNERQGPRGTVYGLFRRWQRNGTWRRVLEQLRTRADAPESDYLGHLRRLGDCACPPARGWRPQKGDAQVEPPDEIFADPGDHALERSRGRTDHEDPRGVRVGPEADVSRYEATVLVAAFNEWL